MSAAIITASALSLVGLIVSFMLGYLPVTVDGLSHAGLAIFVTLVTLFTHCMAMFYLIGKGRAVRDAISEGELISDAGGRVSALRTPVFKLSSLAIALTMVTGIIGGGVDTGVLPGLLHAMFAVMAILANSAAFWKISMALNESSRIVAEVNRDLGVSQ